MSAAVVGVVDPDRHTPNVRKDLDLAMIKLDANAALTSEHAIEIADGVWWVGHYQEDDAFQCHVYLVEHGDQSILIDPGSRLTFAHSLSKIEEVTSFSNIRYFICHHQDPDITGALPVIDSIVSREDALIITHWRAEVLLKHYGLDLPFWRIEDHEWQLDLGGRVLKFIFTPYAHFPGAFCSFDERTGVLFSSDIFGGFTEGFSLVAQDEGYLESMRPFHEHYIPGNDVMQHALARIQEHPVRLIAPQHGSIIPEHLVSFMIEGLRNLDCGLYLLAKDTTDLQRLRELNHILRDITETMIVYRDFKDIAAALLEIAQRLLPARSLEFHARAKDGAILHLAPGTRFRGVVAEPAPAIARILEGTTIAPVSSPNENDPSAPPSLLIPLASQDSRTIQAVTVIHLDRETRLSRDVETMIDQMRYPLEVAVERETIYRMLDLERVQLYERSIRDPLTGLFTRLYMQDSVKRLFSIHDREEGAPVAMAMVDIDHFKSINDTYGHTQGDDVLRRVAGVIQDTVRTGDIPVRLGGEEFAVFVVGDSVPNVAGMAERLRVAVAALVFEAPMAERTVTISLGVAIRHRQETLQAFMERADKALYDAKRSGRNRVCQAKE